MGHGLGRHGARRDDRELDRGGIPAGGRLLPGAGHDQLARGPDGGLAGDRGLRVRRDRPGARAGRLVLAIGGLATVGVGLLPVDRAHTAHVAAAGVAFVALATWPAVARDAAGIGRLAPWSGPLAASGMSTMAAWYALEMQRATPGKGSLTGLAERTFAVAQALWPLVVVVAARTGPAPGAATAVAASAGVRARRWPWRLPRAATR